MTGSAIPELERLVRDYRGIPDFTSKLASMGFEHMGTDLMGTLMARPGCHLMFAVLPAIDPDRLFTLVVQEGEDASATLVSEGEVLRQTASG